MNKRFEKAIQAAVLAGSIAASAGLVASCDAANANSKKSSSSGSSADESVLGVDNGTSFHATESPYTLTGTKPAGSSLWINGVEAVPRDAETTWSTDLTLNTGSNVFTLIARDRRDRDLDVLAITISYVEAPALDDGTSITVGAADLPVQLAGTKAAGADVRVDGEVVVEADDETTFVLDLGFDKLSPGDNTVTLSSRLNSLSSGSTAVTVTLDTTGAPILLEAWTVVPCSEVNLRFSEPVVWGGDPVTSRFTLRTNRMASFSTGFYSSFYNTTLTLAAGEIYGGNFVSNVTLSSPATVTGNTLVLPMATFNAYSYQMHGNQFRIAYTQSAGGVKDLDGDLLASFNVFSNGQGYANVWQSDAKLLPDNSCSW